MRYFDFGGNAYMKSLRKAFNELAKANALNNKFTKEDVALLHDDALKKELEESGYIPIGVKCMCSNSVKDYGDKIYLIKEDLFMQAIAIEKVKQ